MDVEHFEGIVEIDETYFLYSQKGQRGLQNGNLANVAESPNIEE